MWMRPFKYESRASLARRSASWGGYRASTQVLPQRGPVVAFPDEQFDQAERQMFVRSSRACAESEEVGSPYRRKDANDLSESAASPVQAFGVRQCQEAPACWPAAVLLSCPLCHFGYVRNCSI